MRHPLFRLPRLRLAHTPMVAALCLAAASASHAGNLCAGLSSYTVRPLIGGSAMDLCNLPARALLVVNTASECGFTVPSD